ncbi:AraC family transcriptional regulator [Arachidicoccus ginsenosidimutans]|uniref:AraC family transcriptional regulator n=1 Tax=Arachidicoccus sp. BS20 TaxID=1850526 RepID=UPI0007F0EF03|nr:AraC family transcriptional regulator [Arachidicoccus sp. BS20]ANI89408.1 AraC family transcriptional regulator [Arachidicoccus sp. BS20]
MGAKTSFSPIFESIEPTFGTSFLYKRYDEKRLNNYESLWHYHPELELVYVNSGAGKRQIGSHLSHYRNGDLILIGSNLPHCGFTGALKSDQQETVIQWKPEAFGAGFFDIPEMYNVKMLFEKAKGGIIFHGQTKRDIGAKMESIALQDSCSRLLTLLDIFREMAAATDNYTMLNASHFMLEAKVEDHDRINRVFNFVKENFKGQMSLDEMSNHINMTPTAFCKYFKKITNKTFVQFLTEYRLVHAAKLLHESNMGVSDICYECGFNNYSHFTKKFKEMSGKTPLHYRNELKFALKN